MSSRRQFLKTGGALIVAFSWSATFSAEALFQGGSGRGQGPRPGPELGAPPGDQLDSWLAIDRDGIVTLFSGKVELGTGVQTALAQIVAEELDVALSNVRVVLGETGRVPNQGITAGSKTLQTGGVQVRRAAAEARRALIDLAAAHFGSGWPGESAARIENGVISIGAAASRRPRESGGSAGSATRDSGDRATQSISYGDLVAGRTLERRIDDAAKPKDPAHYTVVGKPAPRIELPAKVFGTHEYVHNVRLPGMLHGRVIRPAAIGAGVDSIDDSSVRSLPGFVAVVHRGAFVGVVAEREEQAIAIAATLGSDKANAIKWTTPATVLPEMSDLEKTLRATPGNTRVLASDGTVDTALDGAAKKLQATYSTPFQSHGSIGPSCAVADVRNGEATIWSGTQGSYSLRAAVADLLQLPAERVRVVWTEASGCYGHNGADDVAADAALLSQAVGKPVRVQWSRRDEHGWDPKGPAMLIDVRGGLDAGGNVIAWDYVVSTTTHATRPGGNASNLLAAQLVRQQPPRLGAGGGDRNARHSYAVPNNRVAVRWLEQGVIRPSALRGLGAPANVFANESFLDELASAARVDPLELRLRLLKDPRAVAVVQRVAELAQWKTRPNGVHGTKDGASAGATSQIATGRGLAFLQYENENTYVATVAQVEVNRHSGAIRVSHVFVAHDCGLIINPDGLRNQIEGGTIQTISRTLKEQVTWDRQGVTSVDWASYPILTFADVPETIAIALIDHPELPALGAGEASACAMPAVIGNAVFDAVGVRLRHIPFTPARVKAALDSMARADGAP